MSDIDFVVLWGLVLIALFYIGGPLLVRFRVRLPGHPKLLSLDMESLPPEIAKFLMARTRDLFELGFDEPTLVHLPNPAPHVTTYLILLVNRPAGDKALVTVVIGERAPYEQSFHVEFSTRFESGAEFNTHNISLLLAFPPGPQAVRTQVPSLRDPVRLYELHNFVMNKHVIHGKKVLYQQGEALDYLARFTFVKSYEEQVQQGWLFYEEPRDMYRPTFKGAFLLAWGLVQPVKSLRKIALAWRARRILREFEQASAS